jgi:hypothetical protein
VKPPSEDISQDVVEQAHTYAMHPEIAASFFLVTNGRRFRLYETAKLEQPALEWNFEDQDDNLLRLLNVLSPEAFRKRARANLVDPGKPLGKGLASKLRIIGGQITYEEHTGNHPMLPADTLNGLSLPVTGGLVTRVGDKRILGNLLMAKATPLVQVNAVMGISDDYDFFSAAEYISNDPEHPTIFQNMLINTTPAGKVITLPGVGRVIMPLTMSCRAFTEAVGFVREDKFVGTMRLQYDFTFSEISPQAQFALARQFGPIPSTAKMTGAGRFEIQLQNDI